MLVRTRRLLPLAVLLLIASPAFAGTLVTYAFDSSSSYFTNAAEGWENSYCADTWTSALNGGVCPKTDDGCNIVENCGGGNNCGYNWGVWQNCTASDPIDNHIQFGSNLWEDYIFSARMKNDDNDTFGFVFRYKNSGQYYLFFLSREYAPTPGGVCPQNIVGSRLFRIHGSEATSLAGSSTTYTQGAIHEVRITVVGGAITIEFDANSNGAFEANEKIISVVDANPLPAGRVGFYAYDNGATAESACVNGGCWFDDLEVDVLGLADDPCNGVSWEGQCDGNTLKYCEGGQVHTQQCQCCTWFQNAGYYACAQAQYCQNCTDECSQGQWGCSDTLSHAWTCGQSDNDPCLERTWTVCDETGFCDPIAGECAGAGCVPSCQGKQCGPDGCGGSCGSCPAGSQCGSNGQCACVPSCGGKQCGPDGCGGSCGTCDDNESCTVDSCTNTGTCQFTWTAGCCHVNADCDDDLVCKNGTCQPPDCIPDCAAKECGGDGCGGSCGQCAPGQLCQQGQCVCVPDCTGKVCGPDGCGGSCGECPAGEACNKSGQCECVASCAGKECGGDGCGGSCGFCLVGEVCEQGLCICVPSCDGLDCGPDGCGGTCGVCGADELCQGGICVCVPQCDGKECGEDGCGGLCGSCDDGFYCEAGKCVEGGCEPQCEGKECGFDGCDGLCGECTDGKECMDGLCQDPVCEPSCIDKECGPDGCGGSCGGCEAEEVCDGGKCLCVPQCENKNCGNDGCGGSCGECEDGWYCKYGICSEGECLPDCSGKECGNDGCGGVCGTCAEGFLCSVEGACEPLTDCQEKNELGCVGDAVYWFDSCGNQGELLTNCTYGCEDGSCLPGPDETDVAIPTETDAFGDAEEQGAAGGETVTFDSGAKSGGCTASSSPATGSWLLVLLLLVGLGLRRRPTTCL